MFKQQTNKELKRIADALELIAMVASKREIELNPFSNDTSKVVNELAYAMVRNLKKAGVKI